MSVFEKHSNNQGGKRAGAGRKQGKPNKLTAEAIAQTKESGLTPLEYMLDVMRNSSDERMRMSAAQAAAPYVHAKLSTVDVKSEHSGQVLFGWLT